MAVTAPRIVAYMRPTCGWSSSVRTVLSKYGLGYESRDIANDSDQLAEMVRKTGQSLSPCVEIDGVMLADVGGEEIEAFLLGKGIVPRTDG